MRSQARLLTAACSALAALAFVTSGAVATPPIAHAAALEEVTGFGSNPGNLRMFRYVPAGLPAGRPLVVVLHGCTQSAAAYDDESGWVGMAERLGFAVLLPQQQPVNNGLSCFNWFEPGDTARGSGEALSIKQMADRLRADVGSDADRIFVTGLSAGGAMAAVMLATYPEMFSAGAVVAGLPYRCASTLSQAQTCQSPGVNLTPRQWGDRVRGASGHTGPWPTVSIWHGTSDTTVAPSNLAELVDQWTDVAGADQTPDVSDTVNGYPHRAYRDNSGRPVVETFSITGMGHGQPIDPGTGPSNCGTAAPYILDVNICAANYIADFWGLVADQPPQSGTTITNIAADDGYVKASADGSSPTVGTLTDLAVGRGTDGKHNRTLLSFDTLSIPAGVTITRARLTVTRASGSGDPWSTPAANRLLIDARTGCFDTCSTQASDWAATATATSVAEIAKFTSGVQTSTEFSTAGIAAINRTGKTQLKLYFEKPPTGTAYVFLKSGDSATLTVEYQPS